MAEADALGAPDRPLGELFIDLPGDQDTRACQACLARGREYPGDGSLDRPVQVGVGEHDVG